MPLGIPHSVFMGRPVGLGEPQWLETDRGYALAWRENNAATCVCGTREDEWQADRDAYISGNAYCEGCARLADERANVPKTGDDRPAPGYHTFLTPRELYRPQIPPAHRH